jgi:hypothetical protein
MKCTERVSRLEEALREAQAANRQLLSEKRCAPRAERRPSRSLRQYR